MFWGRNISKIIDNKMILESIDIFVKVWEIKTIIWPSWWGKSTLLSCLSNIENPTNGTIFMDDININFSENKKIWKKEILHPKLSLLSQWLFLRPHLSVKENVLLPLREQWLFDKSAFDDMMKILHIDDLLEKYPMDCSWWERQRVAIARQILLKPKYLLLDEITSALDIEHIQIIVKILNKIKKKTGIIVVTHMIHFAKKISDYIYFLDHGKITEHWTVEILDTPKTKRLSDFLNL